MRDGKDAVLYVTSAILQQSSVSSAVGAAILVDREYAHDDVCAFLYFRWKGFFVPIEHDGVRPSGREQECIRRDVVLDQLHCGCCNRSARELLCKGYRHTEVGRDNVRMHGDFGARY